MMVDPRAGDGEILGDNIHGQARFMGLVVEQGEEDTGSDPLHVPPLADTEAVTEPLEIIILIPEWRPLNLLDQDLPHGNRLQNLSPQDK